jgi:hypothetical protein
MCRKLTNKKEKAMKNGVCPMCQSNEVYMTDDEDNLSPDGLMMFYGFVDREMGSYASDLYVCLTCGYMALFASPIVLKGKHKELTFLKEAKGWKKAM